jgi:hypothetical protein
MKHVSRGEEAIHAATIPFSLTGEEVLIKSNGKKTSNL